MIKTLLNKQLHIFDLDDTLINTRWSYQEAQLAVIKTLLPNKTTAELKSLHQLLGWFCKQTGSGNTDLYFDLFIRSTISDSKKWKCCHTKALACYNKNFESNLIADPNGVHFLKKLTKLRKNIAIVSNGVLKKQLRKLNLTKLEHFFKKDRIYVSSQYAPDQKKPSSFMIDKACQDLADSHQNAVYYGNTQSDIIASNLADVCSVFIQTTDHIDGSCPIIAQPNYKISNWSALK